MIPCLFNYRIRSWFAALSRSILVRWRKLYFFFGGGGGGGGGFGACGGGFTPLELPIPLPGLGLGGGGFDCFLDIIILPSFDHKFD